jgi:hypothetical protein
MEDASTPSGSGEFFFCKFFSPAFGFILLGVGFWLQFANSWLSHAATWTTTAGTDPMRRRSVISFSGGKLRFVINKLPCIL